MERLQNISVIEPITPAIERVKVLLFRPFDLAKWFTIGFCAWLAYLGQGGGGGFNFPGNGFDGHRGGGAPDLHNIFGGNLPLILTLAAIVSVVVLAIVVVCLWLGSRGKFMFLHCVATNRAEVSIPWHKYRQQGNSLFLFRIVAGIITLLAIAILAGIITGLGFLMYYNAAPIWMMVVSLVFISLITVVPLLIVIGVFFKLLSDFVVPIMFLRSTTAVEAWREFRPMLSANKGAFTLYILFQIVIAMAIGALVFAAVMFACCACCCTACLWFIPYISTVIMLPVLIFRLAYSLNYLRQFGMAYDVFAIADGQSIS
ncbi:MAG: hypothetical protein Q7T18_02905 [Sedimentisphaerales bacterium]|nr:hypothetical protein [Sedimentisphaerales bacterium]